MSTVDFFVIVVMILSIILAVLRGFTREVLTIVGFIGSALAVIYGLPIVGPLFQNWFKDPTTAQIAAGLVLGLVTLIVISLISHQLAKGISKVGLGMVDHMLGAVFGAARAALVLCLCFIAIRWVSGGNIPAVIADAKSTPLIAKTSDRLVALLPEKIQADITPSDDKLKKDPIELTNSAQKATEKTDLKVDEEMQKAMGKLNDALPTVDKLENNTAPPPEKPTQGYAPDTRGEINKLIQNNGNTTQ